MVELSYSNVEYSRSLRFDRRILGRELFCIDCLCCRFDIMARGDGWLISFDWERWLSDVKGMTRAKLVLLLDFL